MPHLQSAPKPRSDTEARLKTDGALFKRGTTKQGTPNYVSEALLPIVFSSSSVGKGKRLRYFLIGPVYWLA